MTDEGQTRLSTAGVAQLYESLSREQRDGLLQCLLIAALRGEEAMLRVLEEILLCHATEELIDEHSAGASVNEPPISLGKLAYACHIYDAMTDYGRSLYSFRQAVHGKLDLTDHGHRQALLKWLNAWTCRIDLDYLEPMADGLAEWFGRYRADLPSVEDCLLGLSDSALEAFLGPFDQLSDIKPPGSRRKFGPTAASKTLFALCPAVFVPWDALIREQLVGGESGAAYVEFLKRMRDDLRLLREQCSTHSFGVDALPEEIDRPGATPAQLVGEYHWVKITRGATPPDCVTLEKWAAWSQGG